MFIDWPIWVNHYVHAFRIAAIVQRWTEHIIINDWKIWGDPLSWSGSVNNWYFKENKYYYVSSYKNVELHKDDIITLHVKIDANVSRPYLDQDPMSLWQYNNPSSTWTSSSEWPFKSWTGWIGTWIQYWTIANPNFLSDVWYWPSQYRWYARTLNTSIGISCSGEGSCSLWNDPHNHASEILLPPIAPHAPNYVNALMPSSHPTDAAALWYVAAVAEWDWPSILYPGRFIPSNANTNIPGWARKSYQPWTAAIRFIWPSTWWDNGTTYPDVPPYDATFPYNEVASSSWFMFGIRRQLWLWSSQSEDFS